MFANRLGSVLWINAKWDSVIWSWYIKHRFSLLWRALIRAFSIWFWLNYSTLCDALAFIFDRNLVISIWLGSDTYRMCSFDMQIVHFHLSCIFLMLYSIKKRFVYIIPFIVYFKWVLMTGFFLFWICSWPSAVPGIFFSKPYTMYHQQPTLKNRFPVIIIYQFLKYTCVESTFGCTTGVEFLVVLF